MHKKKKEDQRGIIVLVYWLYLLPATFIYNGVEGLFKPITILPDLSRHSWNLYYAGGAAKNATAYLLIIVGIGGVIFLTEVLRRYKFLGERRLLYYALALLATCLSLGFIYIFNL